MRVVGRIRAPALPPKWRRAALVVAALCCGLAALGFVLRWLSTGPALLLGLVAATPYLGLLGVLGFVLAAWSRAWALSLVALALVVAHVGVQVPLFVSADGPAHGRRLVVLTANLKLGTADPHAVIDAVRRDHVDVLVTQELTPALAAALHKDGLDRTLPHSATQPRDLAAGTGIWSRYPLLDVVVAPAYTFALITARLDVPGLARMPAVVGLHMAGPVPSSTNWRRDIARLPGTLKALPRDAPVIVGGDFNATPDTAQFRRVLGAGFADAAHQAGAGITATFPADQWFGPLIAIDHVLTREAVARSASTVSIKGSDHRGLLVTVALRA